MGFLDELKNKAREGLGSAKEKASGLVGDVRDRLGSEETPTGESAPEAETTTPVGPADDLGAGAAGAAGTIEAADTMSPVDVGAAVSSSDRDASEGPLAGEAPSIGDVSDSTGYGDVTVEPNPSTGDAADLIGDETYFGEGVATGGIEDPRIAETSGMYSDATTGLGGEPAGESGYSADEVSGGLTDSRDDALDAGQAEGEERDAAPDQP